ncbi:hypothetical protein G7Y89_g876 [Cudoniella acicularis]|uniref:Uncharacterized protein n=1 Tax=Cudoniella acicularis TaxID=354080 RepID=A0A8H4WAT6_9HELO|nr:hypothetical protein G7Y89_g876 [Cudoniella acicularis]
MLDSHSRLTMALQELLKSNFYPNQNTSQSAPQPSGQEPIEPTDSPPTDSNHNPSRLQKVFKMSSLPKAARYVVERCRISEQFAVVTELCSAHDATLKAYVALPYTPLEKQETQTAKCSKRILQKVNKILYQDASSIRELLKSAPPLPEFIEFQREVPSNHALIINNYGGKLIFDKDLNRKNFYGPTSSEKEANERNITIQDQLLDRKAIVKAPMFSRIVVKKGGKMSLHRNTFPRAIFYGGIPSIREIKDNDLTIEFKGPGRGQSLIWTKRTFETMNEETKDVQPPKRQCCKDLRELYDTKYEARKVPVLFNLDDYYVDVSEIRTSKSQAVPKDVYKGTRSRTGIPRKPTAKMAQITKKKSIPRIPKISPLSKKEIDLDFALMAQRKTQLDPTIEVRATLMNQTARFENGKRKFALFTDQPDAKYLARKKNKLSLTHEEEDLDDGPDTKAKMTVWHAVHHEKCRVQRGHTDGMMEGEIKKNPNYLTQRDSFSKSLSGSSYQSIIEELQKGSPDFDRINQIQRSWKESYLRPEVPSAGQSLPSRQSRKSYVTAITNEMARPELNLETVQRIRQKFAPVIDPTNPAKYTRDEVADGQKYFTAGFNAVKQAQKYLKHKREVIAAIREYKAAKEAFSNMGFPLLGVDEFFDKKHVLSAVPLCLRVVRGSSEVEEEI